MIRLSAKHSSAFCGSWKQVKATRSTQRYRSYDPRPTAIPCQQIVATTLTADVSNARSNCASLFGYADLRPYIYLYPPSADTLPYILSAVTRINRNTGGDIRFRFDVRTGGAKVESVCKRVAGQHQRPTRISNVAALAQLL